MPNMITGIISITIGAVMLSSLFMTSIKAANQTGTMLNTSHSYACPINCTYPEAWSASEIALWGLLGLIGVVGLVYGVLNIFGLV